MIKRSPPPLLLNFHSPPFEKKIKDGRDDDDDEVYKEAHIV
jgi:hypothetical protein